MRLSKKKIGCKRWMTVSPAYNLLICIGKRSSVQLINVEMFKSICTVEKIEGRKTPAGQKTGGTDHFFTYREI